MSCAARRVGIEVNLLVGVVQEATSWTTRPIVAPRACVNCIGTQLGRCRIHALSGRKGILACLQVVDGTVATGAAVRTKLTVLVLRCRSCGLPAREPRKALVGNGSRSLVVKEALHTHGWHIAISIEQGNLAQAGGLAGLATGGGICSCIDRVLVCRAATAMAAGSGLATTSCGWWCGGWCRCYNSSGALVNVIVGSCVCEVVAVRRADCDSAPIEAWAAPCADESSATGGARSTGPWTVRCRQAAATSRAITDFGPSGAFEPHDVVMIGALSQVNARGFRASLTRTCVGVAELLHGCQLIRPGRG